MANNLNDFTAKLKLILDKASVTNIQKELSKKNLSVKTEVTVDKKSSLESMKNVMKDFSSLLPTSKIMGGFTNSLQQSIKELKEIDTYLTEISKSNSTLSKSDLSQIGNNSFDIASKYGKKSTDYLSAVQEMMRAGYKNATDLAELSIALQSASSMTAQAANSYIIATDKAYNYSGSIEKLKKTLDGANNITANNAVRMTELANGISLVGSKAASLGVEAGEAAAVLSTMISTTRRSGSEMATAFEGILLNIQQIQDAENGITSEGLTNCEKACNALNVSLRETKNGITTLRDPMEILKDLAVAYSKLDNSDSRKTDLLNSVGNDTNAEAFGALLENYDAYENMLKQYDAGTRSLEDSAVQTADSWEGSLNRLSNTWTDTVENVANSDAIITIINGLNNLLSVLNKVTDQAGSLGTIGALSGLLMNKAGIGERTVFQW